jgi:phage/plasmid primase-like uncharacterized protein
LKKQATGYCAALAAGLVILTACTEDSAVERSEQEHIERLQELDETQETLERYKEWDDARQRVPTEEPSATPEPSDTEPQD